ncbi:MULTISPECIES: DUF7546 family protein [Haladaptatus]|uniref:Uncharacterized protein n=1 Tax=Haladaptatus paucihalophilus DX253 TaxID=797209 RepID=A0A1M6QIF2_HALPU|nr:MULTISPECIES: hypothetical protein [Haladaptatus]GKZ13866.1 hypothetical protein HAL_17470 [Haladaptatus sp. T7]SHK20012.1 hypothetical protein SAMN05444342_0922 [Haladaptatus paucihalophilus DX253]
MSTAFARYRPSGESLLWAAVVLNAELFALLLYFATSNYTSGELRYLLYPFIWINVAVLAVWKTNPIAGNDRDKLVGLAVAAGYFLLVGYFGGLFGPAHSMPGMADSSLRIAWLPPGWGPALLFHNSLVRVSILPFKLVGYLALAYLVYATILDAAGSAISGILGLFSCVSCSWPIVASLVTGVAGAGSGLAATVSSGSYDISTVVFVVTVALLYWRPTIR